MGKRALKIYTAGESINQLNLSGRQSKPAKKKKKKKHKTFKRPIISHLLKTMNKCAKMYIQGCSP